MVAECLEFSFNWSAPLKGIVWCQVDGLQLVFSAGGLWGWFFFLILNPIQTSNRDYRYKWCLVFGGEFFCHGISTCIKYNMPKTGFFL